MNVNKWNHNFFCLHLLILSSLQVPLFPEKKKKSNNGKAFSLTIINRFPKNIPRKGKDLLAKNKYSTGAVSGIRTVIKGRYSGSVNIPGYLEIGQYNLPFHINNLRNHIYSFSVFMAPLKQAECLWALISSQISPQRLMSTAPVLRVALVSVRQLSTLTPAPKCMNGNETASSLE